MPKIELEITVHASVERVFDLARCIDLHAETMNKYREKAVAGITKGLINSGESVTWEAVHFGFKQRLTSRITEFDRPRHFRDVMVSGAFKSFTHDHFFTQTGEETLMRDVFVYSSPFGFLGRAADAVFLENYMQKILRERNELIKSVAESNSWQKYLA
ncbi:MAG TPA: SRPBCC family protein [Pyrinomonadaceae bacterium]|jgi:ligand-binding SRPBCC domain-containing protein|nr:SRPBCC family protein [Pyrinomonadaceae bacterium]